MFQNSKYISLQEATKHCNYSQEYLSLRARQGKLNSIKLGKDWVTTREWLKEYLERVNNFNNKRKAKKLGKELGQPHLAFVMAAIFILLITSIAFSKDGIIQSFEDLGPYLEKISYQDFSQNISEKISQLSLAIISPSKSESSANIFGKAIDALSLKIINFQDSEFVKDTFGETFSTFKEYGLWLTEEIEEKTRIVGLAISRFAWKISDSLEKTYRSLVRPSEKIVEKKLVPRAAEEGMVVIPSTEQNEEVKQKIKEAFSDEVKVEIEDKTSGIITPVFREKEGEKYLYILVPIKN